MTALRRPSTPSDRAYLAVKDQTVTSSRSPVYKMPVTHLSKKAAAQRVPSHDPWHTTLKEAALVQPHGKEGKGLLLIRVEVLEQLLEALVGAGKQLEWSGLTHSSTKPKRQVRVSRPADAKAFRTDRLPKAVKDDLLKGLEENIRHGRR